MKRIVQTKVLILGLLLCIAAEKAPPRHYLNQQSVDVFAILPPPARQGAAEQKVEIEAVLEAQKQATDADRKRAVDEDSLDPKRAFQGVVGQRLIAEQWEALDEMLKSIADDTKVFSDLAKSGTDHWPPRARPCNADPRVVVIEGVKKPKQNDPGYPSGHSLRGVLYAELLAELMPDLRDKLMERGLQIGWDRVIAGVHYPSDVSAGRVLGHNIAQHLLHDEAFVHDLRALAPR